ncbi:TatD-related deoxyribonuclease [Thioalkalivibrio sp. K90mix]|uniref:TatD family hydrolase n=1 Tax=Thioalkalivibrio sp. (strain K90mix) TaxID=396595 RepID=UPI000195AAF5|nr:TatD family hydrolase [Thioalkalivibrio sp. K90mix]ADC73059.1 TatD-related deoxyribonuclease [Thioalkalivibrio sp. K90mix]
MHLIDTHVHLDLDAFDPDRPAVLDRARAAGVQELVLPGVTRARWPDLDALHRQHAGLHIAYGLHPIFLQDHADADLDALEAWLEMHPEAIAVGEIGLDGYKDGLDWDRQWRFYTRQLAIARERDLPVIIHSRRALDAVLKGLRQYPGVIGILHAFIGSPQQARQAADLGCCLGIGGPVTYERAKRLHRVVREAPLEALVVETDAPDQPLAGHQGERNEPMMTAEVNRHLARLRDIDPAEMAIITSQNARRVLRLPNDPDS